VNAVPPELDVLQCPLDASQLVEASAGTGKTWTIVSLVVRLVLERDMDIARILVVTFTEAATAELRERIRSRFVALLRHLDAGNSDDPFAARLIANAEEAGHPRDVLRARLALALDRFDEAAIFTIHGFCRRALADAAFASAQPFELELIEDDADLRREVVADFWRRHVAGAHLPEALLAFLRCKYDSPGKWAELAALKQKKPLAQWRWPGGDAPVPDVAALQAAFDAAHRIWRDERDTIVALLRACRERLNASRYKEAKLENAFAAWDRWFAIGEPLAAIESNVVDLLATCELKVPASRARLGPSPSHPFFDAAEHLLALRNDIDAGLALARLALLRRMVETTDRELRVRKRDHRVVAFDDLLWNLYERLHVAGGEQLAAELRRPYDAALLDEFQDTDPVQFAIFRALFGAERRPWFLVGDPKQAIYGFRNADVHAYLAARSEVATLSTLAANQRATPALIDAQNALFGTNPRAFVLDEIDYVRVHAGVRARPSLQDRTLPRRDFVVWTLPHENPLSLAESRTAAVGATAAEIARLLAAAQRGEIRLGERALVPQDIAVLVRSHRDGLRVREGLSALGIGSVELGRQPLFATSDADDLARVLAAIAEPARSGLVRTALATVIFGRDAHAIESLADDDGELAAVTTRFAVYREIWLERGIASMLRRLVIDERVIARLLARDDGERRLVNLRHLGEALQDAARAHRAPDALLHWLAAQREDTGTDEAWQLRLESDRNLVRIVTVHKAKGLEFPITFCPLLFTSVTRIGRAALRAREYHEGGVAIVDMRDEKDDAIESAMRIETAAEEVRLQYVALTRASHRAYIVAGVYATASGSMKDGSRAPLNWLAAGAAAHPDRWFGPKFDPPTPDAIAGAWQELARKAPDAATVEPIPTAVGEPLQPPSIAIDALVALPPPPRIGPVWRIGSFSSLVHGAILESAASDHDARATVPTAAAPADLAATDILRFPRGRSAGDCLHAVFERADFADRATWSAATERALREHPQPGDPARLAAMVETMLADVTTAEMPGGFALRDVQRDRRLPELEFHLPAPRLAPSALQRVLAALDADVPRLATPGFGGFVHGFIDLVFEHDGRWYLADWKSNHLGTTRDDYALPALNRAMREHGYHLQYLLYALALQRFLRHRLRDFAFEQHFGGVLYLFVRGVRAGWPGAGIFHGRPSAAELAGLEAALGARAAA